MCRIACHKEFSLHCSLWSELEFTAKPLNFAESTASETDPHMHVILNTTNGYGHAFERQAALPPACRAAEARSPT